MDGIQRILFIELLGGIGDVVMALPAIHALAKTYSAAELTVLTFSPGGKLLEQDPLIHHIVYAQAGRARQAVDELLARQSFDLIVSDTNYDGIATAIEKSGAKKTVTNLWRSPPPNERVSDRFLEILTIENIISPTPPISNQPHIYLTETEKLAGRQLFGAAYRPLVFLCVDVGMSIKRWATASFIALGQALQQHFGATIIVPVGFDQKLAVQIREAIGGTAQILPRKTLRDFASAIAQADLVIAADTGPAHIAAALNVPTITLFGPSWHGRYGQARPNINLQGFPECPERIIQNFTEQSCWYSGKCPFDWQTCLDSISVESVLAAATKLLRYSEVNPSANGVILLREQSGIDVSTLLPEWRSVRNLLVMRLDNIGDVIMTSPALRAIKENLPDAKITLMASPSGSLTAPVLADVDVVLPWRVLWQDLGRLEFDPSREWELVNTLKDYHFDAAIIFTSFAQSPHPPALICALAGIPLRLGESKEQDAGTLTHTPRRCPDTLHQTERNLQLIEAVGFRVRDRRLTLAIPESKRLLPASYILLSPWTSCQSRNYPPERFAIAAQTLSKLTGWSIVVTGVEKDKNHAQPLFSILGDCAIDLLGKTSLTELVALVAGAKLLLTNNTSTMHIADATNTPNVVLFAGTEQIRQWQPRHSPSRILNRLTVCSPCYAFTCPYGLPCLDIHPDAVVQAALELLEITGQAQCT